jgi:hypothetical protein
MAAGAGDNEGGADRPGEKREKEREEKEEEADSCLSFSLVAPQQSTRLRPIWCHVGTRPRACSMSHISANGATPS